MVAKGYIHIYCSNYEHTFSPTANITSSLHALLIVVLCSLPLYQWNDKNVFLHGDLEKEVWIFLHCDLEKEVYIKQLPNFVTHSQFGLICKLHRPLYGLKQSPQAWLVISVSCLRVDRFHNTTDNSIFYHHKTSRQGIYLVIYLNNIVTTSSG